MTETTTQHVCQTLAEIAPLDLTESWDNVGLLVGDREKPCSRVMTCLTISPPVVAEAIEREADMIVTHHPLPFKPIVRLTTDTTAGKMLWELANAGVGISSFTQADISNNLVEYVHNGSETTTDSFEFTVNDGVNSAPQSSFAITGD